MNVGRLSPGSGFKLRLLDGLHIIRVVRLRFDIMLYQLHFGGFFRHSLVAAVVALLPELKGMIGAVLLFALAGHVPQIRQVGVDVVAVFEQVFRLSGVTEDILFLRGVVVSVKMLFQNGQVLVVGLTGEVFLVKAEIAI